MTRVEELIRLAKGADYADIHHVYGHNGNLTNASVVGIWDADIAFNFLPSASVLSVYSSSANDAAAGTGAQTVYIEGLSASYNIISETITLAGNTEKVTADSYICVNKLIIISAGSTGTNAGRIFAGTGYQAAGAPPTTLVAQINYDTTNSVGEGKALQCMYTIPANSKGFLFNPYVSSTLSSAHAEVWLREKRENGSTFTHIRDMVNTNRTTLPLKDFALEIPEKSAIYAEGISAVGTNHDITVGYTLIIINGV